MKTTHNQSLHKVISALMGAVVGASGTFLLVSAIGKVIGKQNRPLHSIPFWLFVLILGLSCMTALALHELGHLYGGLRAKFRFLLFVVGPLRIQREEDGHIRVRFNREIATYGGMCACVPTVSDDLVRKFAALIALGPLFSLIGGIVAVGLGRIHGQPFALQIFCLLTGSISLMLFVVTAIPMPNGVFLTDGARWLRLRRGGELGAREAALLHLYAVSTSDSPISEWSEEAVRACLTPQDDSVFEAAGNLFAYSWHLDQGDITTAGQHLDRCIEIARRLRSPLMASYFVEAAWFAAWHRRDAEGAEALLRMAASASKNAMQGELLRARAAIAIRKGSIEEGRDLLEQSERHHVPAGSFQWVSKRIAEMHNTLTASSATAV